MKFQKEGLRSMKAKYDKEVKKGPRRPRKRKTRIKSTKPSGLFFDRETLEGFIS